MVRLLLTLRFPRIPSETLVRSWLRLTTTLTFSAVTVFELSLILCFCRSSLSQTRVPAVPVSMETAAAHTERTAGSILTYASVPKATRGRGVTRFCLTSWLPNRSLTIPPLQSRRRRPCPPPLPPLSQSPSPLPRHQHLPPCSHGNPNLGRGRWWYRGRRAG